jgi:hypothetical protein
MSSYRRVIIITLLAAGLLAAGYLFLSDAATTLLFSVIVVLEAFGDLVATGYVLALVLADTHRPRSWLLLFLLTASVLITAGLLPIAIIVVLRALGLPPLPNGLGLRITGTGLVLIGAVPLMKASLFFLVNREASKPAPPLATDVMPPDAAELDEILDEAATNPWRRRTGRTGRDDR